MAVDLVLDPVGKGSLGIEFELDRFQLKLLGFQDFSLGFDRFEGGQLQMFQSIDGEFDVVQS